MQSRDLLQRVGQALYGERWQSALAVDLGVTDRMVRKWLSGENEPRPGVWTDLLKAIKDREVKLREVRKEVERLPN